MRILVTGASGQLGQTIKTMAENYPSFDFDFKSSKQLDITNEAAVAEQLQKGKYDYCINCAAYTHVDKAEQDNVQARNVNSNGPKYLAIYCAQNKTTLFHVSTDFVFDGFLNEPYREQDIARPIGFYGDTKYKGERHIAENLKEHFIFRTSWLYSEHGHNFLKTMMKLGKEKEELAIVYDQVGTPTYTADLVEVMLHIMELGSDAYGIYHYSNEGIASWYDFAKEIFELNNMAIRVKPILSAAYPTPAKRPKYSVLDKAKVKGTFGITIPYWKDSLKKAIAAAQAASV
ncbi:dTDP-4-dehydrorhamnose reductase [Croceivirga sp. JEA036]|uniref:dTDP-4-dehydrorhamnose reductase n=1 Tax=Croceivirga sp. JEA036 TaxID=2721162 RepID=UPI00143A4B1D|nr:dTDP-4-dehydrorhamnose reductase [Croceivirga sp. JEA036]NJB36299.1 dTDP-4-dehydrorhamnose reductase [Croceivirga sp. JEA036]